MKVLRARNVATALPLGVDYLLREGAEEPSRNGPVLVAPGPVTTIYARPQECVLFNAVRDANPAFHLLEAAYMLAGRSDATFLNNYIRDFGERFAEPNGDIHGGYGKRWRSHFGFDQIAVCIDKLRRDPRDRQAVIQMWDCEAFVPPFREGADDLRGQWRDRPCNLMINLRIREGAADPMGGQRDPVLDMMTTSRSHDILLGLMGANSVHFAILQQYLAAMIGVSVGTLTFISWNYHVYVAELQRLARRAAWQEDPPINKMRDLGLPLALLGDAYATSEAEPARLVDDAASFDRELEQLMGMLDDLHVINPVPENKWRFCNPFLSNTVWPVAVAMRLWRLGQRQQALAMTALIQAPDWRLAAQGWFERRLRKLEAVA